LLDDDEEDKEHHSRREARNHAQVIKAARARFNQPVDDPAQTQGRRRRSEDVHPLSRALVAALGHAPPRYREHHGRKRQVDKKYPAP
jgi:hypothetical protein